MQTKYLYSSSHRSRFERETYEANVGHAHSTASLARNLVGTSNYQYAVPTHAKAASINTLLVLT